MGGRVIGGRVLCVTQDPQGKQRLFEQLVDDGYQVDVATDRRKAVTLSEREIYDVAVVDQRVAVDDGIAILHDIECRQDHVGGVLCCEDPRIADVAIAAGVKHVVANPYRVDDLVPLLAGDVRESARRFDERFRQAADGFATEEGIVKGELGYCESCNRVTSWHHERLARSFCSADCLARYLSMREC